MCEKCWNDAGRRSFFSFRSKEEEYAKLIRERENNPCTPQEQAGVYWDEERQVDTRYDNENDEDNL